MSLPVTKHHIFCHEPSGALPAHHEVSFLGDSKSGRLPKEDLAKHTR